VLLPVALQDLQPVRAPVMVQVRVPVREQAPVKLQASLAV